ncbi:MAG: hypothetical protein NWE92_07510 [Candidatus Bathyarchaeota archaeon]|nr:hypothetical protein [Candidatus Bathyarchaeota archaeon]
MTKNVLADEERACLKIIAMELREIRKRINILAETIVKISDKEFRKSFNASPMGISEKQLDNYQLEIEKQASFAEDEFKGP